MKSEPVSTRKPEPRDSLERVLGQSEEVKGIVEEAASELTSVNEALHQAQDSRVSVHTITEAITQNVDVEHKVAQAADDLSQINIGLANEVAERVVIESELAETKADLAEARSDLSTSQANEESARIAALQDALTGLPNRVLFEHSLDHGLIQAKRHGWGLAVLFIDIDKFKSINDSHGHDMGDRVLLMVAERLRSSVRDEDTVSRWGGDEFVCLLLEVKHESDMTRLAQKMVNRIAEAFESGGTVLSIRASIGIATYPGDGETAEALLKSADTAMYKAKGTEKGVVLFSECALG